MLETIVSNGVIPPDNYRCNRLIEDLQSLGINVSDIKKLQDAGIHTIGGDCCILKQRKAVRGNSNIVSSKQLYFRHQVEI